MADTLQVNLAKSKIYWKGTKMMNTGKHEGSINLKMGILYVDKDYLVGGYIVADMQSI